MTTAAIAYDFDTVEAVVNVGVLRHPELLTSLTRQRRIIATNHSIAKHRIRLANNPANTLLELELMQLGAGPRGEPAALSVVVAASQE
mmetsp:Transcript_7368/g.10443  ORF Transcript_7368/g.10443 Transcript_7368/m.10443 type:complete len:88 (+) Transcript_7368:1610-1873(+)|eukprot:CAMPEP_0185593806 /NCGR_PEP_ID=MMETSP0434-20130131/72728_1 /TAXON_ID=626734 ORGANISM="Favella taraikaensis, Strain Fe Narragansett Bay" /NCGR_SAMPLE_ID=MMETSP0434 /ASSEMBLY_ACC=CAM_ASM_000379 /LENGTH=87 /DNA_ID=CAMNT_0028220695 /DNA_START=1518 /DNA_END=1781 /DNA_ORIENTATION=+